MLPARIASKTAASARAFFMTPSTDCGSITEALPPVTWPAVDRKRMFQTTQWSVVLRAGSAEAEHQTALATLCQDYWRPVYGYIRWRGYDAEAARDLTQG